MKIMNDMIQIQMKLWELPLYHIFWANLAQSWILFFSILYLILNMSVMNSHYLKIKSLLESDTDHWNTV